MSRPSFTEELSSFEVFTGRNLTAGKPLIARLVGRRFDELFDGVGYSKPYDASFGKSMVKTLSYLLTALGASFGFAEQAELSLFAIAGGGDARRLLSRLAGEASAKLSLLLGTVCTFEAKLYELTEVDQAVEYFRWRQAEAHARAVERYCLFVLGQSGTETQAAGRIIEGLGPDERVELLRQNGLDFQGVPSWQRRGASVALRAHDADGSNGSSGQDGDAQAEVRSRLIVDLNLPSEGEFGAYLKPLLGAQT